MFRRRPESRERDEDSGGSRERERDDRRRTDDERRRRFEDRDEADGRRAGGFDRRNDWGGDRKEGWNKRREDNRDENEETTDDWEDRRDNDRREGWNKRSRQEDEEDTVNDQKDSWNQRKDNYDRRDKFRNNWNDRKGRDNWNDRKDRDNWNDRKDKGHWNDRKGEWGDRKEKEGSWNKGKEEESGIEVRDKERSSPTPSPPPAPVIEKGEWICRCGALNFKRRLNCYRQHCGVTKKEAISAPQESVVAQAYSKEDIPRLAAYSTQMYATNPQERVMYLKYYTEYYTQQLASTSQPSELDRVNAAAAVAQSAINQMQARNPVTTPPNGVDGRMYPVPDVSTYLYDESSGYYYDSTTGLYYDPNTQYYFNNQINQYLFWDVTKYTYILASTLQTAAQTTVAAPTSVEAQPAPSAVETQPEEKKKGEKTDKVKVAKKIAKDMERWARTQNQKKEMARTGTAPEYINGPHGASSGSADIGFSVLEQRVPVNSAPVLVQPPQPPPTLVPSYGGGSDSSGDESENIIDWSKLACLLCKRQFPSREVLEKHQLMSDLHKQNLEVLKGKKGTDKRDGSYRDRAAERRMKYGEDDAPVVRTIRREPPVASLVPQEIGEENIGNKLLQKMGWSAGQGLGKEGQGRVGPVEASTGGLGRKRGIYTAGPGETYRGCVKKLTMARYQDLVGSESNT